MKNQKLIQYVQALIILPIITMSGGASNVPKPGADIVKAPTSVLSQKFNNGFLNQVAQNSALDEEKQIRQMKADAIDAYFSERDMPLAGLGMKMVLEAEKNDLDWRLLPAIAIRESTGGKFECKKVDNSAFGWGSCKINFDSHEHGIEVVARNLGGNNPKTARHYADKNTMQILRAYNPPSIVKRYAEQVMSIMDAIGPAEVSIPTVASNS